MTKYFVILCLLAGIQNSVYSQRNALTSQTEKQTIEPAEVELDSQNADTGHLEDFSLSTAFQADIIFNDFNDFYPVLDSFNVDLLNSAGSSVSFEIGGTYKRYYYAISMGFNYISNNENDSLETSVNSALYGLHFGYVLLDKYRIRLTPKVALKWYRYKLINNNIENRIPIETYLEDRDLDIRFNQLTGFIGLTLSYKLYNTLTFYDYWTIGFYGGYLIQFNKDPWIYSKKNRLTANGQNHMQNINLGITFSFIIN